MKARSIFLRTIVLAAALSSSLASCGIPGLFPSDLVQMSERIDLSSEISPTAASSFRLAILKLLGAEYVLLFSTDTFDATKTHLFVLSPTLHVQNRYTMDDIVNTVSPAGEAFKGSGAVTRLLDNTIIMGNVVANASATGLVLTSKLPNGALLWGPTIVGPSPAGITLTGFSVDTQTGNFSCQVYDSSWTPLAPSQHPLGQSIYFRGAFSDPGNDQSNAALLVFEDVSSNTDSFVLVPKVPDLAGGWPAPPILGNPQYPVFTRPGIDGSTISVTAQGIAGYDNPSQSWVRFLPSAPGTVKSLSAGSRDGSQGVAFSYDGGYFCTFDPGTRALTRFEKWW